MQIRQHKMKSLLCSRWNDSRAKNEKIFTTQFELVMIQQRTTTNSIGQY